MGSSDSCDSFRPAGLPSSRQNFPDTPPFYAPPCFPRQKSSLALLFGFTHYETLAAWVVGVTGRNSEGSLALRLIRLYDRASTVESPLPWPVILSDRRFLIRVNTFQFTSSAKFAWRTIIPLLPYLSLPLASRSAARNRMPEPTNRRIKPQNRHGLLLVNQPLTKACFLPDAPDQNIRVQHERNDADTNDSLLFGNRRTEPILDDNLTEKVPAFLQGERLLRKFLRVRN